MTAIATMETETEAAAARYQPHSCRAATAGVCLPRRDVYAAAFVSSICTESICTYSKYTYIHIYTRTDTHTAYSHEYIALR